MPQDSLLNLLNKFSYKKDRQGVCYGFAHMAIKAFLLNPNPTREDGLFSFRNRWQEIIEGKEPKDIHPFFNEMMVYHQPHKYPYLFEENQGPKTQDAKKTSSLFEHQLHGAELCPLFKATYTRYQLIQHLTALKEILLQLDQPAILSLGANSHQIAVGYLVSERKWVVIDANLKPDLYLAHESELADQVMRSFFEENIITMETTPYGAIEQEHRELFNLWSQRQLSSQSSSGYLDKAKLHLVIGLLEKNKGLCQERWLQQADIAKEMIEERQKCKTIKEEEKGKKEAELPEISKTIKSKQTELDENNRQITAIKEEIRDLTTRERALIDQIRTTSKKLTVEKKIGEEKLEKLKTQKLAHEQKKERLEDKIRHYEELILSQDNEIEANTKQIDKITRNIREIGSEIREEIKALQCANSRSQQARQNAQREKDDLDKTLRLLNDEIAESLKQIELYTKEQLEADLGIAAQIGAIQQEKNVLTEKIYKQRTVVAGKEIITRNIEATIKDHQAKATQLRHDIAGIDESIKRIPEVVLAEFKRRFESEWGNHNNSTQKELQVSLEAHVTAYNMEQIMEAFFTRHPWLRRDLADTSYSNTGSPYLYLVKSLHELLLENENWKAGIITREEPTSDLNAYIQAAKNSVHGKKWLETYRNNYPIQHIRESYLKRSRLLQQSWVTKPSLTHTPHRLDVYRLIYNLKFQSSPSAIPVTLSELQYLADETALKPFTLLVINIAEEEAPKWIVAFKSRNSWNIYTNPDEPLISTTSDLLQRILGSCQFTHFTAPESISTDLEVLGKLPTLWNIHLFSIIIPCLLNSSEHLATYHQVVPLPILWWNTLKKMWDINESPYGMGSKEFDVAFKTYHLLDNNISKLLSPASGNLLTPNLEEALITTLNSQQLLEDFDKQQLILKEENTCLQINHGAYSSDAFTRALYHIYHTPGLEELNCLISFAKKVETTKEEEKEKIEQLNQALLEHNVLLFRVKIDEHLETIDGPLEPTIIYATQCAARNRFLHITSSPEELGDKKPAREKWWPLAGQKITTFFQKPLTTSGLRETLAEDDDFIIHYVNQYNPLIRRDLQVLAPSSQNGDGRAWQLAQIAHMGTKGLDAFFDNLNENYVKLWNEDKPKQLQKAPNLRATFDLSGNDAEGSVEYIKHLTQKIELFGCSVKACSPLFQRLSLILPSPLNADHLEELKKCIISIQTKQLLHLEDEPCEIVFFNIDIDTPQAKLLMNMLEPLAKAPDFYNMVTIPGWDRVFKPGNLEKQKYRDLQNTIGKNLRVKKQAILAENLEKLAQCARGDLRPEIQLNELESQHHGVLTNAKYQLITSAPGIQQQQGQQQQMQQQMQQEHKQQEQQQEKQQEEQEEEHITIELYQGNSDDLISRENIESNDFCKEQWAKVPVHIREKSGAQCLTILFSKWVGSHQNADYIVKYMEPEAVAEVMQYASSFRMGLIKDNLPAGFYLKCLKSSELILCFSQERKLIELEKEKPITKSQKFKMVLHERRKSRQIYGDVQQLQHLSQQWGRTARTVLSVLWQYMTPLDYDETRIKNARELRNLSNDQACLAEAITLERYPDYPYKEGFREYFENNFSTLETWIENQLSRLSFLGRMYDDQKKIKQFINHIIPYLSTHLLAFGQLMNEYDGETTKAEQPYGTQTLLLMAYEVYDNFGQEHFDIWTKSILSPSENWSECLAKKEVDALAMSIVTLKDKPNYQSIWWCLVNAHGAATGPMQYAPLWSAFHKLIHYAECQHLQFNLESLILYLQQIGLHDSMGPDFHGSVFLERLYDVLKNAESQLDYYKIQQDILDDLHAIDWMNNGFHYASRYRHYFYPDPSLKLEQFTSVTNTKDSTDDEVKTYRTPDGVSALQSFEDPVLYLLRFVAQGAKIRATQFPQFQLVITQLVEKLPSVPKTKLILRLFTACHLIGLDGQLPLDDKGLDKLASYAKELINYPEEVLKTINSALDLNQTSAQSFLMFFKDIPFWIEASAGKSLYSLDPISTHALLNACGRVIHFYSEKKKDIPTCKKLLEQIIQKVITDANLGYLEDLGYLTALECCPWISLETASSLGMFFTRDKPYPEIKKFAEQLRSIDFINSHDNVIPTNEEIQTALLEINVREVHCSKAAREKTIQDWAERGCIIRLKDANFRLLNTEENQKINIALIERNSKPLFAAANTPLTLSLLECLALPIDTADAIIAVEPLLNLLWYFDSDPRHNQLGTLLGVLITKAKEKKASYAAPQLYNWLSQLRPEPGNHFPIDLIATLLDSLLHNTMHRNNNLINTDLDHLGNESNLPPKQQIIIKLIIKTEQLPERNKAALLGYALNATNENEYIFIETCIEKIASLHKAEYASSLIDAIVLKAIPKLLKQLNPTNSQKIFTKLDSYTQLYIDDNDRELKNSWQKANLKLIDWEFFNISLTIEIQYLIIISTQLANSKKEFTDIFHALNHWKPQELRQLALYVTTEPKPSKEQLEECLNQQFKCTEDLIHHFETEIQGVGKRHYSVEAQDRQNLLRILKDFKEKKTGVMDLERKERILNLFYYLNAFSVVENLNMLKMGDLQSKLHDAAQRTKSSPDSCEEERYFATAQVLACLREIVLRKTGKWAKHTQMLDLLCAGLSEDSLLHQIRTGEGKSIITIMRTSFLALQGNVVDVFTAKESLSERDHEECAPVLDAMGIRHAYISADSPANTYHDKTDDKGIGAVNYATMGNFSLYCAAHGWNNTSFVSLSSEAESVDSSPRAKRVAYMDECDHILHETTQFNYASNDGSSIYNEDAWVYQVIEAFYDKCRRSRGSAKLEITGEDLRTLSKELEKLSHYAPDNSLFYDKYIRPATTSPGSSHVDEIAVRCRDKKLMQYLKAAHNSYELKEDVNFFIREERQAVGKDKSILVRVAKVLIDSQVKEGATYSESLQQFLHARLNRLAIAKGEPPNFFIAPESRIILSFNAPYVLNTFYDRLEGCTGTAGNKKRLKEYAQHFGIQTTIKMPTHEEVKTKFLPKQYCDGETAHVKAIYEAIYSHADQPILITCANDKEAKRLHSAIQDMIRRNTTGEPERPVYCDTNASGFSEQSMLGSAGKIGAVTFSARLGRGTDIKPEGNKGLMVLRTYSTEPEVEKQERGRQGRNGSLGIAVDIIDFDNILKAYERVKSDPCVDAIYKEQKKNLENKLQKHAQDRTSYGIITIEDDALVIDEEWIKTICEQNSSGQKWFIISSNPKAIFYYNKEQVFQYKDADREDEEYEEDADEVEHTEANERVKYHIQHSIEVEDLKKIIERSVGFDNPPQTSDRHDFLRSTNLQEKEIIRRTMAQWEAEQSKRQAQYNRQKERLVANASGQVLSMLYQSNLNSTQKENLKACWKACCAEMEELWSIYHSQIDQDKFTKYKDALKLLWTNFCHKIELSSIPDIDKVHTTERREKMSATRTQKPRTLAEVLAFYQQWIVKTSAIKPELKAEFAGLYNSSLNQFYQFLYNSVTAEESSVRARAVMDTMTHYVLPIEFVTRISCKALHDTMKWLMQVHPPRERSTLSFAVQNEPCFQGLVHFSKEQQKQFEVSKVEDMRVVSHLLAFMRHLIDVDYQADEINGTRDLITYITRWSANYWKQSPLVTAQKMITVFSKMKELFSDAKFVKLITTTMNQADINELLSYIVEITDDSQLGEQRLEVFTQYFITNEEQIYKNPWILKNLVHLFLDRNYNWSRNNLPKLEGTIVSIMEKMSPTLQKKFWYFLTQHQPLDAVNIIQFSEFLNKCLLTYDHISLTQLGSLLTLPPYVPFHYINHDQVVKIPGKITHESLQHYPQSLEQFGKQFKEFLISRDYVEDVPYFSLRKPQQFQACIELCKHLPFALATDFFTVSKAYPRIELKFIEASVKKVTQIGVVKSLKAFLACASSLEEISQYSTIISKILTTYFFEHLSSEKVDIEKLIQHYQQIYSWLNSRKADIAHHTINYEQFVKQLSLNSAQAHEFLQAVQAHKKLPISAITHLWKKYQRQELSVEIIKEILKNCSRLYHGFEKNNSWLPIVENIFMQNLVPTPDCSVSDFIDALNTKKVKIYLTNLEENNFENIEFIIDLMKHSAQSSEFCGELLLKCSKLIKLFNEEKQKYQTFIALLKKHPQLFAGRTALAVIDLLLDLSLPEKQQEFFLGFIEDNTDKDSIDSLIARMGKILSIRENTSRIINLLEKHKGYADQLVWSKAFNQPLLFNQYQAMDDFYSSKRDISQHKDLFDFEEQSKEKRCAFMKCLMQEDFVIQKELPHTQIWSSKDNLKALKTGFDHYLNYAKNLFAGKATKHSKLQQRRLFSQKQHKDFSALTQELREIGAYRVKATKDPRESMLQATQHSASTLLKDYYQPGFFTRITRSTYRLNLAKALEQSIKAVASDNPYEDMLKSIREVKQDLIEQDMCNAKKRITQLHGKGTSELYKTLNHLRDMIYAKWSQDPTHMHSMHSYQEIMHTEAKNYMEELKKGLDVWFKKSPNAKAQEAFKGLRAANINQCSLQEDLMELQMAQENGVLDKIPGHLKTLAYEVLEHLTIEDENEPNLAFGDL